MLSVHTGSSVPAHSKLVEGQYQVAQALTQEESDNLNIATCDQFLAANPKISACNAVMVTELAASDVAKRRRRLPEVTTTITLYFEAGNEVSTADLGALVEPAITGAAEEVIPDNAVTGITYTVSELTEVSEEDIPACANVNDGCGATSEAAADPKCAGGEYWNGDECTTECAGGEYWNGSKCTKCEATYYTETGVYATASGDSDDSGCKRCPYETSVVTWLNSGAEPTGLWSRFGPGGAGWITYVPTMYKYSPAGSEGEDSCIDDGYCMYGQYWDGSACTDCPEDTYYGFVMEDSPGMYVNDPDDQLPPFAFGDENDVCIDCPAGTHSKSQTGFMLCFD